MRHTASETPTVSPITVVQPLHNLKTGSPWVPTHDGVLFHLFLGVDFLQLIRIWQVGLVRSEIAQFRLSLLIHHLYFYAQFGVDPLQKCLAIQGLPENFRSYPRHLLSFVLLTDLY